MVRGINNIITNFISQFARIDSKSFPTVGKNSYLSKKSQLLQNLIILL